jgi:hypothetical protein
VNLGSYDDITPEDDKRTTQRGSMKDATCTWGVPRKMMAIGVSRKEEKRGRARRYKRVTGFARQTIHWQRRIRSLVIRVQREQKDTINVGFTFGTQRITLDRSEADWVDA